MGDRFPEAAMGTVLRPLRASGSQVGVDVMLGRPIRGRVGLTPEAVVGDHAGYPRLVQSPGPRVVAGAEKTPGRVLGATVTSLYWTSTSS